MQIKSYLCSELTHSYQEWVSHESRVINIEYILHKAFGKALNAGFIATGCQNLPTP